MSFFHAVTAFPLSTNVYVSGDRARKKRTSVFIDKKVPQVKFVDRTFNCRHDHAMAIWTYIHEHDNGITNFHFESFRGFIE